MQEIRYGVKSPPWLGQPPLHNAASCEACERILNIFGIFSILVVQGGLREMTIQVTRPPTDKSLPSRRAGRPRPKIDEAFSLPVNLAHQPSDTSTDLCTADYCGWRMHKEASARECEQADLG
jgi:hypothetical protein